MAPSENEFFRQQSGTSQLEKQHEKEKKKRKRKYIYAKVFGSLTCIATAVVWNDSESQKKKKQTKNHFLRHERHRLICIWPHTGRKRLPNRHSTKFPTVAVYSLNLNSIGPRALTTYIYANQSFPKCVSIGLRTCKTPNDVMITLSLSPPTYYRHAFKLGQSYKIVTTALEPTISGSLILQKDESVGSDVLFVCERLASTLYLSKLYQFRFPWQ